MQERTLLSDEESERDRSPDPGKSRPAGLPHSGPDTSRAAAERMVAGASAQVARVFQFISKCGKEGATDHEIQSALAMTGDSERPRRWSLQKAGLIRDSGQRRKSPTGRLAIVWISTDEK